MSRTLWRVWRISMRNRRRRASTCGRASVHSRGARVRYKEGATEFVTVLESQRTLYAARAQYSEYLLARFEARLSLGKALGGGWAGADAPG